MPGGRADPLAELLAHSGQTDVPLGAVAPCPLQEALFAIEVRVVDADGDPALGVLVALRAGDREMAGRTQADGVTRFEGLAPGTYAYTLAEYDAACWQVHGAAALGERSRSRRGADWGPAHPPPVDVTRVRVGQGDCLCSISARYGHMEDTVWAHPLNAALAGQRDDPSILAPDDELAVPPRAERLEACAPGNRYEAGLRVVQPTIRLRCVDAFWDGYAQVPYLLEVHAPGGEPYPSTLGKLDAEGGLEAKVSPFATTALLTVGMGPHIARIELALGYVDPVDTVAGVQARLNNLGYDCGSEDGVLDALTRAALRAFQAARDLPVTGEVDDRTWLRLAEMHAS